MRVLGERVLGTGLLLVLLAAPLQAQSDTWWVRVGLGAGWSQLATPPGESIPGEPVEVVTEEDQHVGPVGFFGVGRMLGDQLAVGLEAGGWTGDTEVGSYLARRTQVWLHGVVKLYPKASRFFVKGGFGVGRLKIEGTPEAPEVGDSSLGYLLGVGYEAPVGRMLVLTPYVGAAWIHDFEAGRPRVVLAGMTLGFR